MVDSGARVEQGILARLDRIPVWPYPRSILVIVGAGFFFAFFDIVTIGFALPVITKQFQVSAEEASWAITSGLIGYILGSFLDSRIADHFGRRVSLFISVAFFSVGSLLSATSPDLGWLIFWRFISGMGIGAEIALVTTYMNEISPAPLRGRYTGWTIVAAFTGFAVVPVIAFQLVPGYEWGWRVLFVAGAVGGVIIAFMRRGLPPSIHWLLGEGRADEAEDALVSAEALAEKRFGRSLPEPQAVFEPEAGDSGKSLLFLLKPPLLNRLILLGVVWFVYYVGNYGWLTLAADLFSTHGFSLKQSIGSLSLTGSGFVGGSLAAVYFSDRVDRRISASVLGVVWGATLLGIGFYASSVTIPILGFIASFTIGFVIPVLYTLTGESFPTRVRATGVSMSDGLGHLGGAFCGQIVLGAQALYGFQGAFVTMAITGFTAAILVVFVRKSWIRQVE